MSLIWHDATKARRLSQSQPLRWRRAWRALQDVNWLALASAAVIVAAWVMAAWVYFR